MRVILTRHYRTVSNTENKILGWGNSPPCSEWAEDVNYIARRLHQNGSHFDAVYSSCLERARHTANTYAREFGIGEVIDTPALKEINYGKLQTKEKTWVAEHYPQYKKNPEFVHPDGESFYQMQSRSVGFLSSLALENPNLTVLIVSHAGVIRAILCHFLGLEFASCLKHTIPFRYIGDFQFERKNCIRYDELGKPSGFVRTGTIEIPLAVTRAVA